ncbi:MAG: hypothetical protein MZW92_35370 [Comamonadaceae bacterium]|nr:hypothetical protein [Comamonadaceae bacterium]
MQRDPRRAAEHDPQPALLPDADAPALRAAIAARRASTRSRGVPAPAPRRPAARRHASRRRPAGIIRAARLAALP